MEELEEIEKPSPENVAAVRRESHLDDILNSLEQEFVSRKSKVILVDKGSHRASQVLVEREGQLKNLEESADQKMEEWRKQCQEQREKLMQFCSCANGYIRECLIFKDKEHYADKLAMEFWKQVFEETGFFNEFKEALGTVIASKEKKFYRSNERCIEAIIEEFSPKFMEIFNRNSTKMLIEWSKNPKKSDALQSVIRELSRINSEISNMWKKVEMISLFQGVVWSEIEFIDDLNVSLAGYGLDLTVNNQEISEMINKLRRGIFQGIATAIGWVVLSPIKMISWLFSDSENEREKYEKDRRIRDNVRKIAGKLDELFKFSPDKNNYHMIFAMLYNGIFEDLLDKQMNAYLARQEKLQEMFEQERVQPVEESFKQSQGERQRLAKEHRRVRVKEIAPLRELIQDFEARVLKELS